MLLSLRKFADFVIWRSGSVSVIRTEFDWDFLEVEVEKAKCFYYDVIMPELLAVFFTKKLIHKGKLNIFSSPQENFIMILIILVTSSPQLTYLIF
jgi:hypothetical protein